MLSKSLSHGSLKGIAIIGMAARVPGAKNVKEFWHNLTHGIESISTFSDEELIASGVDVTSIANDPSYVRAGGVLEDAELFDAAFFAVNPKEAELTDPQGRIILECSWEALEDSGYNPETVRDLSPYTLVEAPATPTSRPTFIPTGIALKPSTAFRRSSTTKWIALPCAYRTSWTSKDPV